MRHVSSEIKILPFWRRSGSLILEDEVAVFSLLLSPKKMCAKNNLYACSCLSCISNCSQGIFKRNLIPTSNKAPFWDTICSNFCFHLSRPFWNLTFFQHEGWQMASYCHLGKITSKFLMPTCRSNGCCSFTNGISWTRICPRPNWCTRSYKCNNLFCPSKTYCLMMLRIGFKSH